MESGEAGYAANEPEKAFSCGGLTLISNSPTLNSGEYLSLNGHEFSCSMLDRAYQSSWSQCFPREKRTYVAKYYPKTG